MARYRTLVAQRAQLVDESKAMFAALDAANRALTAEETARLDAITAALAPLDAELDRWEAQQARERTEAGRVTLGKDLATEKPWKNLGEFAIAVYRAGLGQGMDPRLAPQAAASGMSTVTPEDGGFAVPIEFGGPIEKTMWDTGQILSRVSARDLQGDAITFNVINETSRVTGSRRGGVQGYWVDQGTAPASSQVKLARVEMKLRKLAALGYLTEEAMADAPFLASELNDAFVEELLFLTEDAVIEGSGAGQPLGVLNAPCVISVAKETSQAAASILTTNLSKMWARLPARSKANAVWLINVDCEPQLDELSLPAGTGALEPRFVTYGPDGALRIKGRPVIAVEYCATVGTVGDLILADFSQYRLIRKATGVETASSIHVRFTQGESTLRAIYRVDGQPLPRAAITPFKGTNTLSPFVTLATRA